ncbi:IclR family transcriptional regulator [Leucobacter sp. UT-8R-CII-1-4]|uniref:IclR family transcriptional regulator n=1 Tax=Leucobacter sp. UT-8R-CII-1-4 TaxID=3040075 RepID=UPI0024A8DBC2|nr:IclR family transcriptional regulator [Leucobacter sp. UT-8R-CII-1-4]MDI6023419.1 IclR family transcriptional regulator [Leucobacter sp. UT-8R-CII-1-4]
MTSTGTYHSQGLTRGLAVLRVLGQAQEPMTLAELSKSMEMPKSTLLRLLSVMDDERFVARAGDPPVYSLGPSVFEIAESLDAADLVTIAYSALKALAEQLGFTTNLGVLQGASVLHLCVEEPERALRIAAGGFLDHTYCTGLGKMLLSTLDDDQIDAHLPVGEPWESFTPRTITTRAALAQDLKRIREHGYSVDDQERNRGVRCIAVLVPTNSSFALSLSASGPMGEVTEADVPRVLEALRNTAHTLAELPQMTSALESVRTRWGIS